MESTGGRTTTPAKQTDSSVGEIVEMQLDTEGHQPENGFVSPETTTPGILTRIDQSVLPFLGGFAKYQKQLILLTWIPALFIGAIQYSDNFLLDQPNSTCVQPMVNLTDHTAAPSALLDSPQNITVRPGHIYTNGTYGTNRDVNSMQCSCNEWNFTLHTGLVENVVTKWSLVCNSTWEVHIAKFALLVGSSFGYLVFGILDDWFGRHPMLIISVLSMLVFGLSVAFSVNVPMFSVLRFFEGFCLAGIILSLYLLRIELCLPQWRFFTTMVAWFLILAGQLLMPVVAYLCRDWQVLQVVIICPLLLMLSYIWIFPESLRWLLATQQYTRSNWIMEHIAKKNNVNMELDPDDIFGELRRALHIKPKKKCILTMVGRRNLWKNIAVLCFNSLTGFGIHHCFVRSMMDPESEDSNMFHNFYANFYTKAGITVASCLALCPAVGMMGRRSGLLMFMIITALASLLQLGLLNLLGKYSEQLNIDNTSTLNKNLALAFSIIGMFSSYAVSYLSIFICAEITPTVIRGGGLGLVLASAGFGMLTGPIMDLHNQKGYFLHHIIFACCTLICIICILLLPETRNQPLPETLADGESFNRQTLLNPRKSGEQRFLLGHSKRSTDYTRVHDMPLQEAVTSVMSTMDSAASSASDSTIPSNGNMSAPTFIEVHSSKPEAEDPVGPSGSSLCPDPISDLGEDGIIHASKEHLLSSSPSQQAPCVTEPLLAEEHQKTDNDSVKSLTDSAKSPDPVAIDIQNVTPEFNQILLQETQATSAESLTLSMHDNPTQSQTPSSKPVTDYNIFTEPPPSSSTNSYIPCQDELVDKTTSSPPTKHSPSPPVTPKSDSTSCIKDTSSHPPSPSSPSAPPSSFPHPCTDSGHMSSLGSVSPPVIDIVNTTPPIPTVLPVTDIVHTPTPESAAPTATDIIHPAQCSPSAVAIDSVQTLIDCTVSSPLDCGALSIMDSDSTENTLNGVMSS